MTNSGDQLAAGLLLALRSYYQPARRAIDKDVSLVADEKVALGIDPIGGGGAAQIDALQFFLYRNLAGSFDLRADDVGVRPPLSADPVCLGRGGGLEWLALAQFVALTGRGGYQSALAGFALPVALAGRGGGGDRLWLTNGSDLLDLAWTAAALDRPTDPIDLIWFLDDTAPEVFYGG